MKQFKYSTKEICEVIWSLEKDLNLLKWEIDGIYIWPIIRVNFFFTVMQKTGTYSTPHDHKHSAIFPEKIKFLIKVCLSAFFKNPFFTFKKNKTLIIPHNRKVNQQDIYTYSIINELLSDAEILDSNLNGESLKSSSNLDFFNIIIGLCSKIYATKKRLTTVNEDKLKQIETIIYKKLNIKVNIKFLVKKNLYSFKLKSKLYFLLLKIKKIKDIYLVVSYSHSPIINAAHKLNLQVYEIQHGAITKYHMGYSYPNENIIPYQPNEILLFGNYWADTTPLPSNINKRVIGAPHINNLTNKKIQKHKKSIFFASQGVIYKELFDFAKKIARKLPNYKLTYGLHPSEDINKYNQHNLPENMSILFKSKNVYEEIAKHEYQVGVFSTTLFEGLALKNKILLLNLPGVEFMHPLIKLKNIPLINNLEEFIQKFEKVNIIQDFEEFYAKPVLKIIQ